MRADYPVVLDACVLAPANTCDLLLRLAETPRLYVPQWSEDILAEVRRTQVEKLKWPEELARYWQEQVRASFPRGPDRRVRETDGGLRERSQGSARSGGGHQIQSRVDRHIQPQAFSPGGPGTLGNFCGPSVQLFDHALRDGPRRGGGEAGSHRPPAKTGTRRDAGPACEKPARLCQARSGCAGLGPAVSMNVKTRKLP